MSSSDELLTDRAAEQETPAPDGHEAAGQSEGAAGTGTEEDETASSGSESPDASDTDASDTDASDTDEPGTEAPGTDGGSDPLEVEGEVAADYLEELLDIADLDGDIDTYTEGGRAHVSVVTDADVLVGAGGEVLEALQELARLTVMTETGRRSRLMLDIAGHRDQRRRELRELAGDAVEEAKGSGEAVRLAPMNPFERKIVHDAVAEAGLGSESEGEEPRRRVVVLPG